MMDQEWGPWVRHHGQGMPVQAGTVVEVVTFDAIRPAKGEVRSRVGVAGVDLVKSWSWATSRNYTKSLPIDLYRVKRPKGLEVLQGLLVEIPKPELEEQQHF